MAKKQVTQGLGVFSKTEPDPAPAGGASSDLDRGRIISQGVGLTEGELDALQALAAQLGVKRNGLMRFAIRRFLQQVLAGEIDLAQFVESVPASNRLKLP
jgi:phage terminase Nu1 subunit (DNA packaging protein)